APQQKARPLPVMIRARTPEPFRLARTPSMPSSRAWVRVFISAPRVRVIWATPSAGQVSSSASFFIGYLLGCASARHLDAGLLAVPQPAHVFGRPLAQLVLLDLLRRRLGQFLNDMEVPGHHEIRHVPVTEGDDVRIVDRHTGIGDEA